MMDFDVIIIGAGAAGMMCGARAGAQGKSVLLIDTAVSAGEKIRISGGGRCNFTNIHCGPNNFISKNPHFCKSALAGFSPRDFIALVDKYKIKWHEKEKGQLFCDESANQIIGMLRSECKKSGNHFRFETQVLDIRKSDTGFVVTTSKASWNCTSLVIASGGPSIPKMGASGYGYKAAKQFGLDVIEPIPALVPLSFTDGFKTALKELSGTSLEVQVRHAKTVFEDALLFTHRGLSGPAILQISTYWRAGDDIYINLTPGVDILAQLKQARTENPKQSPAVFLSRFLPKSLAGYLTKDISHTRLADMGDKVLQALADSINNWRLKPAGSEGFRTAEVTLGGVDTKELSSKTFEARKVPGLYFIGEVVDVTGHLGGHNFQWAWASGFACGNALA
ncbi:MAG: NAD(P)/FAD-dependent oxidoreductase [Robiginitomaculum sp.]|nr:NAD(P)/FAD-dependent oxidoreductase [Robiginitomaculum sp.]